MTETRSTAGTATEQVMSLFEEWQKAGLGAVSWANPAWFQVMSEINAEVARFVSERLREDMDFQAEVLQCRDPATLKEIQGRFLKTAFDQYSAETGKLVDMNRAALDALTGRTSGG